MSHPNHTHDRSNEYPDDHYKPVKKKAYVHKGLSEFLTDEKSAIKGGKANAKYFALKKKMK